MDMLHHSASSASSDAVSRSDLEPALASWVQGLVRRFASYWGELASTPVRGHSCRVLVIPESDQLGVAEGEIVTGAFVHYRFGEFLLVVPETTARIVEAHRHRDGTKGRLSKLPSDILVDVLDLVHELHHPLGPLDVRVARESQHPVVHEWGQRSQLRGATVWEEGLVDIAALFTLGTALGHMGYQCTGDDFRAAKNRRTGYAPYRAAVAEIIEGVCRVTPALSFQHVVAANIAFGCAPVSAVNVAYQLLSAADGRVNDPTQLLSTLDALVGPLADLELAFDEYIAVGATDPDRVAEEMGEIWIPRGREAGRAAVAGAIKVASLQPSLHRTSLPESGLLR